MLFINPLNSKKLFKNNNFLEDNEGLKIEIINECIYMFDKKAHYSDNFGFQWNNFYKTQIDCEQNDLSFERLQKATNWDFASLDNNNILEVGSGAGRFTRCFLQKSNLNLYSVDSSDAIFANYKNNKDHIKNSNLSLIKSSVYNMPVKNNAFDKVICLGVLQHTPDIENTIKCLIEKAKPGGEIVIDFYPINGWWTKIHAKYLLRPFLSRLSNKNLLKLIKMYFPIFFYLSLFFNKIGLGFICRFFPICDLNTLPKNIKNIKEWVILDTFDMFSPKYDQPQKIKNVCKIFKKYKTKISFEGYIKINATNSAIVRAIKL